MNTKAGGKKVKSTMIKKYGSREKWIEHLREIGKNGGKKSTTGGFASEIVGKDGLTGRERAIVVGSLGGKISKRSRITK